jgi:predicted membrane protein
MSFLTAATALYICVIKLNTMENTKGPKNYDGGRIVAGLILVGVGAFLLLRNLGFWLPGWLFSWPMILILVGIYSGVKHNFRNNGWMVLVGVGAYFLISDFIPSLGLQPLFWPLLIIGLGLLFIVRPGKKSWVDFNADINFKKQTKTTDEYGIVTQEPVAADTIDSSDFLMVRSVFSGVVKNIVSKNFQGGKISCVFGGAEIDLSQADINGTVTIKLEAVFGGIKLVVPPHWSVQNDIDGVFHGIDDKRRFNPDATINPGKILILKGSAIFGGVEIRSY